jgi:hypothetical protein
MPLDRLSDRPLSSSGDLFLLARVYKWSTDGQSGEIKLFKFGLQMVYKWSKSNAIRCTQVWLTYTEKVTHILLKKVANTSQSQISQGI